MIEYELLEATQMTHFVNKNHELGLRSESGDEGNQIQSKSALSSILCQSKVPGALR